MTDQELFKELEAGIHIGVTVGHKHCKALMHELVDYPGATAQAKLVAMAAAFGTFQKKLEEMRLVDADFAAVADQMQELAREFVTMTQHTRYTK